MEAFYIQLSPLIIMLAILAALLWTAVAITWLFFNHGIDKIKHPEEWENTGSAGERILYCDLIKKFHIPENQMLRNVYIPTKDGATSEIDLLAISKKGLFIFECKNYGGNIYGDARRRKWVQYVGKKKSYFYSPLLQNKNHAKHLEEFLAERNAVVPVVPIIATIARGNWKVRNLGSGDYLLGYNCHFDKIYNGMPDSEAMAKHFKKILGELTPLSRPGEDVKEKHIENIHKKVL